MSSSPFWVGPPGDLSIGSPNVCMVCQVLQHAQLADLRSDCLWV